MTGPGSPRRVLVLRCPDLLGPGSAPDVPGGTPDVLGSTPDALRAFEPVVAIVEEFCPQVEILRPGVCAIATRSPARYFGGEAELARKLAEAIRRSGIGCQVGIADGLFAAGLAARAGPSGLLVPPGELREFLAGVPVGALGMPELCELLPRLGIETLGQLAALPPAEAASRFGPQGMLACRLARGLDPRPLIPRPPAADLSAESEFDPPAWQAEPVIFVAKALADQMHERLAAGGYACVRVQVLVRCTDGQEFSRLWRHDGLLSALAVAERVRWQLEGWRGTAGAARPADTDHGPDSGITLLRLIPDQLVRATGRQLALWGDSVLSDRVARAAIRVQAMLGHEAVTRPVLAGGRIPAEQVLFVPFGDAGQPRRPADRPWPGQIPTPAPATVYPVPLSAGVTDSKGQTVAVTGRAELSGTPAWLTAAGGSARAVSCWAGPWPVTERWWDPPRARRQARFQLVTEDGNAWLAVVQDGRWLIEASYD
ncbi:MAG: DNA polymerase Y family protein [Streptosporangiaceae bacterium]